MKILVYANKNDLQNLSSCLQETFPEKTSVYSCPEELRGFSPELASFITTIVPSITAIILAIIGYFSGKNKNRYIKIKSRDGISVEFPSDISLEKINDLIERFQTCDKAQIVISQELEGLKNSKDNNN